MIRDIHIKLLGPIADVKCKKLSGINLLIGHNGSGKTFFLKILYATLKTIEQYQRGKEPRTYKDLLSESLYWTFQANSLGALVRKNEENMEFSMEN